MPCPSEKQLRHLSRMGIPSSFFGGDAPAPSFSFGRDEPAPFSFFGVDAPQPASPGGDDAPQPASPGGDDAPQPASPGGDRARPSHPPSHDKDKVLGIGTTTSKEQPPSSSSSSPIVFWQDCDWYHMFYIRTDLQGRFHTYPGLQGSPFRSLQEADDALRRHLDGLRIPKMSKESLAKLPMMESSILQTLYWPDGTRQRRNDSKLEKSQSHQLAKSLVDQYNEDHNLSGDFAHELKDNLHQRYFASQGNRYLHFNFTTTTKGGTVDNLIFVEAKRFCRKHLDRKHLELQVTSFCLLKPDDDGNCCGCKKFGSFDMKHPNKADAYCGGHTDGYLPYGGCGSPPKEPEEDLEAAEKRLRRMYAGLDNPSFLEKSLYPFPCTPSKG